MIMQQTHLKQIHVKKMLLDRLGTTGHVPLKYMIDLLSQ